ncbi:hypothetical protein [Archangium sp.]|uniref:hypothetical protein n=1 Tax=Archangium sp. TaxID=1872627 RepID=UPI00286C0F57|nr:hypothetical protein [Archangium sp.]
MSNRIVVLGLVWGLTLVACGPTDEPSPQEACRATCDGCCTTSGRCMGGTAVAACGVGGQECKNCGSQNRCGSDGKCLGPDAPDSGTSTDAGTDAGTTPADAGTDAGTPPPPPAPCGAIALPLVNGKAQVSGTTVGAGRQAVGSCGGIDGTEVVYSFNLANTTANRTDVIITVTPRDAAFQPVVYVRQGTCDDSKSELYQSCVAGHQPGATVQLQTRSDSPGSGTYYVVVDGLSDTGGAFDLSIEIGGRSSDSCAEVLTLPGRQFTVRGSYSYADDTTKLSCNRAGSADVVYRLETSEPSYLRARVEDGAGSSSSFLSVSRLCGGQESTCSYALNSVLLAAGTHYLWLDRYLNTYDNTSFILRADLTAPLPGDACAQARPLVFSNGVATDRVTAAGLHDDGSWSCYDNGADLAYSFTTDRPLALRAKATDSTGNTLSLNVVRATCTQDARVACAATTLNIAELPAGSYFLWVDGLKPDSGAVSLDASLTEPPAPPPP